MIFQKLLQFQNFNAIKEEVLNLVNDVGFDEKIGNQISLQVADPDDISKSSWYPSIGRIKQENKIITERDYCHIHPLLKGSVVEEWINSLTGYTIVRARLMMVMPRRCYSIHRDPTPRIHLPVTTNPQCLMCFPDQGLMQHIPADGHSWLVDTTFKHTFINCSTESRIHLVGVVVP